ncbi:STAS domain-containing protein [Denitromonas iodatirespirans]|uniref:STAS domain-containing protein n=1 Tax=Denitromonas iodatirespirans TaxID=2795389 RepID=A0A944DC11_DENI1|nr:STAS domain-containing protein [Denitromonas iodatirespirans]MBT0962667.1 STAS domain-containing protein [Denitromonas iodatirespirans]
MSQDAPRSWRPTTQLTFETAGEMRDAARRAVAEGARRIDLSEVPQADSAGLALLLDVCREAKRQKQSIDIVGLPDGLTSLADLYGVSDLLPLADSASA